MQFGDDLMGSYSRLSEHRVRDGASLLAYTRSGSEAVSDRCIYGLFVKTLTGQTITLYHMCTVAEVKYAIEVQQDSKWIYRNVHQCL
jgi:hypothetical protein